LGLSKKREVPLITSDLAPGDQRSASFNWDEMERLRITSPEDPLFHQIYEKLWEEFGAKGEVEQKEVLSQRLCWDPSKMDSGYSLGYELIGVFKRGIFVATRDHTAIIRGGQNPEVVVHLSHSLIAPEFRGKGLVGWLRSWPVETARNSLLAAGLPSDTPITLVAEMEPLNLLSRESTTRLKSYQSAGFLMVDPNSIDYQQPDFRAPHLIDSSGGPQPLSLRLVIRRVKRETETEIRSSEVHRIILALYQMYGTSFRKKDMEEIRKNLTKSSISSQDFLIPLIPPLSDSPNKAK
jgi:hypothetical protein